jgi:hypothetical protein
VFSQFSSSIKQFWPQSGGFSKSLSKTEVPAVLMSESTPAANEAPVLIVSGNGIDGASDAVAVPA